MMLSTTKTACDRCKQDYPSSGIPTNIVSSRILTLCPPCSKGLREIVSKYIQGTFSENIESTEEDFHAHGPDISKDEEKKMTAARLEVFEIMKDGYYHTVAVIINRMTRRTTPQSVTIYLRSFREKRYGGWVVNRRKNQYGVHEYQLSPF